MPHGLREHLTAFDVETARYAGLDHLSDTDLLAAIEGCFDILVTLDRNLVYQQKIAGRPVAVIVLRISEQTPKNFQSLLPELKIAIENATPGIVKIIGP